MSSELFVAYVCLSALNLNTECAYLLDLDVNTIPTCCTHSDSLQTPLYSYKHSFSIHCFFILLYFFFGVLQPVDPEREIVIALAAARSVLFQGGPQPWILDSSKFFTKCMFHIYISL